MSEGFAREKARVLARVDLSRKGSVDAAILPLLSYVNARDCYYSTSSCAGRMVLFAEGREQMKKGCHWLLVSHDPLEPGQLGEVLKPETLREEEGYIYFKFEPFVLHVMCATLSDARLMVGLSTSHRQGCYLSLSLTCNSCRQPLHQAFVTPDCHVGRRRGGWWQVSGAKEEPTELPTDMSS